MVCGVVVVLCGGVVVVVCDGGGGGGVEGPRSPLKHCTGKHGHTLAN